MGFQPVALFGLEEGQNVFVTDKGWDAPVVPMALPGSAAMGAQLLPFLPAHRLMILARHGGLCWGDTLEEALGGLERLEQVARILKSTPGSRDIRIERFFQQSGVWLFKFNFESTVGGQPLLTMTEGCAGFFTPQDLAAGKGVVRTALQLKPQPGKRPADWEDFVPMAVESYSAEQLDALRPNLFAFSHRDPHIGVHKVCAR